MNNKLITYFLKLINLTSDEINGLTESMIIKSYPKGSFLRKGEPLNYNSYFIEKGCVRRYKIVDGNDISLNFFTEEQWIISLENYEEKNTNDDFLICVEDTTVVIGDEKRAQEIFKQFPRLEKVSRQIMETVIAEQHKLLTSYLTNKPEDRYLNLLKSRPDIFQRVPQYHIATYVGVKPESLSRIRKKLQHKS